MRIIEARGPVVEAIRRYDPGLRVRWSFEKKRWALEAKTKINMAMLPPVRYVPIDAQKDLWIEQLLSEFSERYITYHEKTYVICWSKHLDWRLYWTIISRDSNRMRGGTLGQFDRNMKAKEEAKEKELNKRREARVYQAWDLFKYNFRKNPWLEDGSGVSIKGMGV